MRAQLQPATAIGGLPRDKTMPISCSRVRRAFQRLRIAAVVLLVAAVPLFPAGAAARPIVVFLSDFGLENEAVGLCHGAILAIDSEIEVVDLTHALPPFSVRAAGGALARARSFPQEAVFVAVVDPGVGTERAAVALRTRDGRRYVAPDNGLLSEIVRAAGVAEAVRLDPAAVNPAWQPGTFDGPDLFAPAAALLATGRALAELGAPLDSAAIRLLPPAAEGFVAGPGQVEGVFERTDAPYGNLWTDITRETVERAGIAAGARLEVTIGAARFTAPLVRTFGDVPEGEPLAYFNSERRLAFALNLGDLRARLGAREGEAVRVRRIEGR